MSLLVPFRASLGDGFIEDAEQLRVVAALDELCAALTAEQQRGVMARLTARIRKPAPIKGLYIYGGVGRGKTCLMDTFFDALSGVGEHEKEEPGEPKLRPHTRRTPGIRMHFHRFMRRVHADLRAFAGHADPLELVARRLREDARVLCFDEFFVSDIGDAMILGELLAHLTEAGVVLVATSNVAPENLYENGLQRRRFLPAIDLLEAHCNVLHLGGDFDYRLQLLRRSQIYRVEAGDAFEESFNALAHGPVTTDESLIINDRPILVRRWCDGVAWFDFDALCNTPRNAGDYVELARLFHTVIISGIPVMDAASEDAARRFIALIDEFYDRSVKTLLGAAVPVQSLYQGERLVFEFERTRSRLMEMQSEEYLGRTHKA